MTLLLSVPSLEFKKYLKQDFISNNMKYTYYLRLLFYIDYYIHLTVFLNTSTKNAIDIINWYLIDEVNKFKVNNYNDEYKKHLFMTIKHEFYRYLESGRNFKKCVLELKTYAIEEILKLQKKSFFVS